MTDDKVRVILMKLGIDSELYKTISCLEQEEYIIITLETQSGICFNVDVLKDYI